MLIWQAHRPADLRRARRYRFAANVLIVAGILLLISPAGWVTFTALAVGPAQTSALASWDSRPDGVASGGTPRANTPSAVDTATLLLTVPRLGLRRAVPPGAHPENLRTFGVGHISWTSMPGGPGIVGIAGHRTTYGAPFLRLNALRPGDLIFVDYAGRRYTYAVSHSEVVTPDRVDVLEVRGAQGIALVACTPVYSAAYRLVVLGTLNTISRTPPP